MGIGDGVASFGISGNGRSISGYLSDFFNRIRDFRTTLLLIQASPGISPAVGIIQGDCISRLFAICIKLYLNTCRTNSILVIAICPCLGYRYAGLSRGIAVRDVKTFNRGAVICDGFFRNRIGNLFAVLVLWQTSKGIGPASVCSGFNDGAVNFCTIRKQVHSDALRAFAILIISVIPGLGS